MNYPRCITANCEGNPNQPGAAGGRCPRCYQRNRRGLEPRATAAYGVRLATARRVATRLEPEVLSAALREAAAAGQTLAAWVRDVIRTRLGMHVRGAGYHRRNKKVS